MSDLANYFSQADRIAELEKKVRRLEISRSHYKRKCDEMVGDTVFGKDKARKMIREVKQAGFSGCVRDECRRIGKVLGLNWQTVKTVWYKTGC